MHRSDPCWKCRYYFGTDRCQRDDAPGKSGIATIAARMWRAVFPVRVPRIHVRH